MFDNEFFSAKWITAVITDSSNRLHLVPIKYTIGDYFVTKINNSLYVFKLDGGQIKNYRKNYEKIKSVLFYDTTHYKPINASSKELELVLEKNSLPKVNSTLAHVFKILGTKEKKEFKPHKLDELTKQLSVMRDDEKTKDKITQHGYDYDKSLLDIINYLQSLSINEIITPLRNVSNFIQEDLVSTDPSFMGTVIECYQRTDLEHRKITNTPSLGGRSMFKVALFAMIIISAAGAGYIMYDEGYFTTNNPFNNVIPNSLSPNSSLIIDPSDDTQVMEKYPTGKSLLNAIEKGDLNYDDLSDTVQKMIDSLE